MRDPQAATERVGRYQLLEPIGTGPNGSVSRAKVFGVAGFERQFAVKRFVADVTTVPALAQALSAAARQYGGLEHPRIARMAEFGIAQGTTFTAVEFVAGLDAMRLLAEAKVAGATLAMGGGLALVSQAARAVGYAHGRGLSHLGLSPTNLIVTVDGDVKVTDFGILAATMAARPTEVPRLANRIAYMAPEQIAGEAISAATDVFVLGVIAYELVTNQRAFRGDNAHQIARAVLSGPPADPPLPRPIVRVLQRCLARSPFERFPDARALADALDAALRVAPVPGTRKDIGAQVKSTLDRLSELNESQMSGMLALNLGTGPVRGAEHQAHVPTLGREVTDAGQTSEFVRPDTDVPLPSPLVGPTRSGLDSPAITRQDLPKAPFTTMAGLAPPPIPVPPGVMPPPSPPPSSPIGPQTTMLGMATAKKPVVPPSIPPIKPRGGVGTASPPVRGAIPELPTAPPPRRPSTPLVDPPAPVPAAPPAPVSAAPPAFAPPALVPTTTPTFAPTEMPDPHEEPTRIGAQIPKLAHSMRQRTNNDEDLIVTIEGKADRRGSTSVTGDQTADRDATVSERDATLSEHNAKGTERNSTVAERNITRRGESEDGDATTTFPNLAPARTEPMEEERSFLGSDPPSAHRRSGSLPAEVWRPDGDQPAPADPPPSLSSQTLVAHGAPPPSPPRAPSSPAPEPRRTPPPIPAQAQSEVAPLYLPSSPGAASQHVRAAARPKWLFVMIPLVVIAAAAGGAYLIWGHKAEGPGIAVGRGSGSDRGSSAIVHATADAATQVAAAPDASMVVATAPDGAVKLAAPTDATAQVAVGVSPADAGATIGSAPPASSDVLAIASSPAGARVFIDGADQGVTPVKLPGSADRHTVALLLAGHELYVAEVDGHGAFQIALKPVTPAGGPAGIKVIKCKDKDRYYVSVDGKPTGMTCPTERIECEVGAHTVEVYDIVTETRRKFDIKVLDTRLSYRVRVE